jgi:hypothetical protein
VRASAFERNEDGAIFISLDFCKTYERSDAAERLPARSLRPRVRGRVRADRNTRSRWSNSLCPRLAHAEVVNRDKSGTLR